MDGRDRKIKLGISIGDPNGVGIEIILKLFEDKRMYDFFSPIVFASTQLLSLQRKHFKSTTSFTPYTLGKKPSNQQLNVVECLPKGFEVDFGKETQEAGKIALKSLQSATKALKGGDVDVLVTAPINKHNIQTKDFDFPGHTDYLANALKGESLMFMVSNELKVGLLTDHIPDPKIAVLGINPHTGDNGVIGKEDDEVLRPTLKEIYDQGTLIYGPYAADSFFGTTLPQQFDAVLATYHDQGLIPFKTLTFGNGVNFTAGLSKVRTSPDHGTAFDIAGKGVVSTDSFEEAMFMARKIFFNRQSLEEATHQDS